MVIEQRRFTNNSKWELIKTGNISESDFDLVLVFGNKQIFTESSIYKDIRLFYPMAEIILNSTAGEICDTNVSEESVIATAIKLNKASIKTASIKISEFSNSYEAGYSLANNFSSENLKNVFIISDGQVVNGSELVLGLQKLLAPEIIITGGMAGDGISFMSTVVGLNEDPVAGTIVAVAFYGDITVTFGCYGGWKSFGPERLITKSDKNILYELDNQPALEIYKKYLGDKAKDLPGAGLLFPLSIRNGENYQLVRTIINIDETNNSLTFAGNMPEGDYARLMNANLDKLIEGSYEAAQQSKTTQSPDLAILISCVGRKMALNQRVEEEIEEIRAVYGEHTVLSGFYSYGEIAPSTKVSNCELHNQTMTITTFTEK